MKKLMRNKGFLSGTAVCLVISILLIAAVIYPDRTPSDGISSDSSSRDIPVNIPDIPSPSETDAKSEDSSLSDNGKQELILDVGSEKPPPVSKDSEKALIPDKPVAEKKPDTANKDGGTGGIQIGGGGQERDSYRCGSPKHHCEGPETHAYILNLEQEGCAYCGAHDCPSFYGADQWGNAGMFPDLCPKYDIRKDPVHYCQDCDRKTGDGTNETCVQFVNAASCPNCDEYVEPNTCHKCR